MFQNFPPIQPGIWQSQLLRYPEYGADLADLFIDF